MLTLDDDCCCYYQISLSAGHHAWKAMFQSCMRSTPTPLCECDAELSLASMKYDFIRGENSGLFGTTASTNEPTTTNPRSKSNFHRVNVLIYPPYSIIFLNCTGSGNIGPLTERIAALRSITNRMKILRDIPGSHLFFVGLECVRGAGMLSYPNQEGIHKAINHPVRI